MSAVTAHTPETGEVLKKASWKLPITFGLATLLLLVMALKAEGDARIRLNSGAQAYRLPDWTVNAPVYLWVFLVLALAATAYSVYANIQHNKTGLELSGRTTALLSLVVGLATVFGFLLFAGAGSSGAITLTAALGSTVAISTPLIFGSLSGVMSEHAGVVNIAIEGDLLVGAFAGILVASYFHSAWLGLLAAPFAGAFLGCLLALISVKYGVDQIITGVVLNVLALGLTSFFSGSLMTGEGQAVFNTNKYTLHPIKIPGLAEIPVIGPALFNQTIIVYVMYVVVVVLTIMLYRSRWGLRMRAVGEHPKAADTVGIKVNRTRARNAILASAIAGFGGAFFTLGSGLAFTENISAGNGYIALAAMILGKWHPLGALAASLMFGFATSVAQMMPNLNGAIPSSLLNMIPYVITIIAVAGFVGKSRPPAAENIPYVK
ncbi:simple sugar transport system permease protein [Arcanobacterium wilhelmae]|uniref:Simple sugar transport system permease protein n=1 Tax=Arcanobacterium wilhelmae TaxID=1803177 RepID=A0ABT9NCN3_9ACTO|nr:ABC transporter permease [Arcanobacterium wilhelmae]MDP9801469.1 simple sugar transport system permease protein [Arcanobacterium wilhelmae]WFN90800.1 ABC transporter permease [Arcanobacterium wilhelmae]